MIDIQGTNTAIVLLYITADRSNSGTLNAATFKVFGASTGLTFTQTGVVNTANTEVFCNVAGWTELVLAADVAYSLGAVTLGSTITKEGYLNLGNGQYAVSMTSLAKGSGSLASILKFGDAKVTLSGTLNASGITCQSNAATGTHAEVHGGTVSNVSIAVASPALDCTDRVTNGGTNSNVWFPSVMGVHSVIGGGMIGSG